MMVKKKWKKAEDIKEEPPVEVQKKEPKVEEVNENIPEKVPEEEPKIEEKKRSSIAKIDINPKIRKGDFVPEELIAQWKSSGLDLSERLE